MEIRFDDIASALRDFAAGKPLVVVDDQSRENEGDIILPAQHATPEWIHFCAQEARGHLHRYQYIYHGTTSVKAFAVESKRSVANCFPGSDRCQSILRRHHRNFCVRSFHYGQAGDRSEQYGKRFYCARSSLPLTGCTRRSHSTAGSYRSGSGSLSPDEPT
jgi:hypothetical protein